ncbi:MAG TPA: LamG domain-containing protein [Baekduia sp.]
MQGRWGKQAAARVSAVLLAALGALCVITATAAADTSTVIGQWRFDEGAGQTAVDDGPFGLDGRLGSTDGADPSDPVRIAGASGGALKFDGRAYVRLPDVTQLEPPTIAIEAVVRAAGSPGTFRYVVSRGAQSCFAGSYGLYSAADGGLAFYVFNGRSYTVSAALAPADVWNGEWHHAVGMYDGRSVRLYLDGRPVGAPMPATGSIAYALTSNDAYVGTYQGSCALPLTGDVDLVRIWGGALSPDYVAQLSDAALHPPVTTVAPPPTSAPDTVPTASTTDSDANGTSSRPPITPIAAGQQLAAAGLPTASSPAASAPGAPPRACVVKSSAKKVRVGRKTSLTVHVALRGKPLRAVKVVATEAKSRKRLASGKTARDGKAKLKVKPERRGSFTVKVLGRTDCGTAAVSVVKK